MLDLLGVLIVAALGFVGYRTGLMIMAARLSGLFIGGFLVFLGYRPVAAILSGMFGWLPVAAGASAALLLIALGLSVGVIAEWMVRRSRKPRKTARRPLSTSPVKSSSSPTSRPKQKPVATTSLSPVDQVGGALLGTVWGASLVLVLSWATLLIGALDDTPRPALQTRLGNLSSKVVGKMAYEAMYSTIPNESLASVASAVAGDPQHGLRSLQEVLNNSQLQQLLQDDDFRRQLIEPAGLPDNSRLATLLDQQGFVRRAHVAGLIRSDPNGLDDSAVLKELQQGLRPMARTVEVLAHDPEFVAVLNDEQLLDRVNRGDVLSLANDPKFNWLATRILDELRRP